MGRSVKKGPYVQPVLLKRVIADERSRRKESSQNLEPFFNNIPGFRWSHIRSS